MNKFVEDKQNGIWLVKSEQIINDYVSAGTPVIKIQQGDEYLFDRETIENMVNSLTSDLLDKFDVSIKKVKEGYWKVKFGNLPDDVINIKMRTQ
jgi:hypothetical protein